MRDGSDGIADWPILNALLNTASHADLVAVHGFGGQAQSAGATTIADGTAQAAERLGAVLTNDPGIGVLRHADAGYETAIETAATSTDWGSRHGNRTRDDALGLDEAAEALDNGWTLPARWYSDPDVGRARAPAGSSPRSWTLLCPEAKLASTGDHVIGQLRAACPVVVTRDAEGMLHGFVNVCRHRAHPVAMKDGCRKLLQCRYHGWTYTLDGRLAERAARCRARWTSTATELLARARSRWTPGAASCSSIPTRRRRRCSTSIRRSSRSPIERNLGFADWKFRAHWVYPHRGQLEGLRRERDRVLPLPDRAHEELQRRVRHRCERLRARRDRAACCASSRPTTRAARTRAGAVRRATASASSTCGRRRSGRRTTRSRSPA